MMKLKRGRKKRKRGEYAGAVWSAPPDPRCSDDLLLDADATPLPHSGRLPLLTAEELRAEAQGLTVRQSREKERQGRLVDLTARHEAGLELFAARDAPRGVVLDYGAARPRGRCRGCGKEMLSATLTRHRGYCAGCLRACLHASRLA